MSTQSEAGPQVNIMGTLNPAKVGVSVGPASVVGWGTTFAAFAAAVLAYLTGSHSAQELGVIAGSSVGMGALAITHIGRYVQSNVKLKSDLEWAKTHALPVFSQIEQTDPGVVQIIEERLLKLEQKLFDGSPLGKVVQDVTADIETKIDPTVLPAESEELASPPAYGQGGQIFVGTSIPPMTSLGNTTTLGNTNVSGVVVNESTRRPLESGGEPSA